MDLFHATGLKNHKASFDATYNAIEFSVNQIKIVIMKNGMN